MVREMVHDVASRARIANLKSFAEQIISSKQRQE